MVLTADVGNSNISIGAYVGDKLSFNASIKTDPLKTDYEYAVLIKQLLSLSSVRNEKVEGAALSSVVPQLSPVLNNALLMLGASKVIQIVPGTKTGLDIRIDDPAQLGSDMVATSVAAITKYSLPAIIIDFGTATKLSAIDKKRSFIGCSIMPGVMISLEALSSRTAQLPSVNLQRQNIKLIGKNTAESMISGMVFGMSSMADGMIEKYKNELGAEDATVIASGGLAEIVAPYCREKMTVDKNLVFDGLFCIYRKNI